MVNAQIVAVVRVLSAFRKRGEDINYRVCHFGQRERWIIGEDKLPLGHCRADKASAGDLSNLHLELTASDPPKDEQRDLARSKDSMLMN